MKNLRFPFAVLICLLFVAARPAFGMIHSLPTSLAPEALSETVPTAFAPAEFEAADFAVEWAGGAISGVAVSLGRRSLEWVRVADVIVLPRGRLVILAEGIEAGQAANAGFYQAFDVEQGKGSLEMPIALISGDKNPIHLTIRRGGKEFKGELRVRFKPRTAPSRSGVYTDPSCSPFRFRLDAESGPKRDDQYIYVGCRLVYAEGREQRTSSVEAFVYWDNVGQMAQIAGIDTPATSVSVWPLRLRSKPGKIVLKAGARELTFRYGAAENLHFGFLGAGLGPYAYNYDEPSSASVKSVAPVLTLYGGYFITEAMRVVAFNATSLNSSYFSDSGLYLVSEQFRTLDRRVSLNLMLGFHVNAFKALGSMQTKFGAPQGIELNIRDFGLKSHNLSLGSFLYPPIERKSYYNLWVRWGTGRFFGEFNYIGWQEPLGTDRAYSRSVGFCVGGPLFGFL